MAYAIPMVTKEEEIWVLRIQKQNGKMQEYRCATENQARNLALVLSPPKQDSSPVQAQ
jgi:hypothetical protein